MHREYAERELRVYFFYVLFLYADRQKLEPSRWFSYLRPWVGSNECMWRETTESEERLRDRTRQVSWKRCQDIAIIAKCVLKGQCHGIFDYLSEFSKKFEMTLIFIFRGLGEGDSWKKPAAKISWHCPFKQVRKNSLVCELMFSSPLAWGELGKAGRPMRIQEWLLCVSH